MLKDTSTDVSPSRLGDSNQQPFSTMLLTAMLSNVLSLPSEVLRFEFWDLRLFVSRLGSRLDAIIGRFGELDEAERVLTGRLKRHRQALAKQKQQKQVWTSLLEER